MVRVVSRYLSSLIFLALLGFAGLLQRKTTSRAASSSASIRFCQIRTRQLAADSPAQPSDRSIH